MPSDSRFAGARDERAERQEHDGRNARVVAGRAQAWGHKLSERRSGRRRPVPTLNRPTRGIAKASLRSKRAINQRQQKAKRAEWPRPLHRAARLLPSRSGWRGGIRLLGVMGGVVLLVMHRLGSRSGRRGSGSSSGGLRRCRGLSHRHRGNGGEQRGNDEGLGCGHGEVRFNRDSYLLRLS